VPGKRLRLLGVADGRSINVHRWARRLVERGHDVFLVSDRLPPRGQTAEGVVVRDVRTLGGLTGIPVVRRSAIGPAIGRLATELDIDLVHAHYLLPYGFWAARASRRPLVMSPWSRDVFVDANESRQGRKRSVEAIAASDYLVVNSEANRLASIDLGAEPERITEIIWYSENDRFAPDKADRSLRARLGWPDDALVVLSLRNYRPYTNLDVVIRAFARAAKQEPRARLLLAARGGPTRHELEALVDELGVRELVAFERVEWEDLPGAAAAADIAITIAGSDSTPASLLEVMASSVPVVAGRTWSIDEWIGPGEGGALVECRDEDAVTQALVSLLGDPELRRRYGERNERVVRERLGDPGEELETLYLELLGAST
jgi:glycosyltransferase involved in cell wall biosynthesis